MEKITGELERHFSDVTRNTTKIVNDSSKLFEAELKRNKRRLGRYRLLVGLLGTFGIVAVINGFEMLITNVAILHTHPLFLFFIGLGILFVTGSLYNRLLK
ncbi:hypothetical protein GW943_00050 [Candidatus Parcubacteria bacterium]|uniref:Uncharacterized protein n=1 Tax=Candidatus Kaiserbacteria bacterium CG10_big_fil_rev_8_21_14_0_10_47_16 TaxID=1974608 RepID=A0A2H0UEP8_9BACT|nr:hypothetical protein [Candidatus Parcubacteria bacterium]PIR84889.1 MAG: hypothetical protein COU16_00300 [Candidatus Kaiserbacteria bacterium CG10_big_fil_rev_8_21_14_0_10_47_16]